MRFISRFTASHAFRRPESRAGGTRTPNRRFWRPVLYQLSYCPLSIAMPRTANRSQGRFARLPLERVKFPSGPFDRPRPITMATVTPMARVPRACLLYTSDAADDLTRVDLGGR